jgi:hypothetical protein
MQDSSRSAARALNAVDDTGELLKLAESAVERARREAGGDALGVADRLKQHIHFLRKVAELLRHEIERDEEDRIALAQSSPALAPAARAIVDKTA